LGLKSSQLCYFAVQELDAVSGEAVCRLFSTDWNSSDAQRALQKARLTLSLRGFNVDTIMRSKNPHDSDSDKPPLWQ